jgi:hypothetical protein
VPSICDVTYTPELVERSCPGDRRRVVARVQVDIVIRSVDVKRAFILCTLRAMSVAATTTLAKARTVDGLYAAKLSTM